MLLTTTTVRVRRPADGDPYETASSQIVAEGIPAHISAPSGSEIDQGGQLERIDALLLAQPDLDVRHTDHVIDETSDDEYRVAWVRTREGLGLTHVSAGLVAYHGGATGG